MKDLLSDKSTTFAVIGATDSPGKFGGIIYRYLKGRGYEVWPVNPNTETVDGDDAYPRLGDLPTQPDIIDFVVPPETGETVARDVIELGWDNVWLQPGAESTALVDLLSEAGIETIAGGDCVMAEIDQLERAAG